MHMSYADRDLAAIKLLLSNRKVDRAMRVAIDGHSAAGKSTLASYIQASFQAVTIIPTDGFYRVMPQHERELLSAADGYRKYYDWERLRDQVLQPLSEGKDVLYRKYNWSRNELGDVVQARNAGIILVDGCYSARPELRGYFDQVILVKAPHDRRMATQRARGDAWEWVERWDAAERLYLEMHDPANAGAIVIGSN